MWSLDNYTVEDITPEIRSIVFEFIDADENLPAYADSCHLPAASIPVKS